MKLLVRVVQLGIPLLSTLVIGYVFWVVIVVLSNTPTF